MVTKNNTVVTDPLQAELIRLRAENEALKAKAASKVYLKVGPAGGISVYGMGRFPVTLFQEQWLKLLGMDETIKGFITTNAPMLNLKDDDEATLAAKAALRAKAGIVAKEPKGESEEAAPGVKVTYKSPVTRVSSRG